MVNSAPLAHTRDRPVPRANTPRQDVPGGALYFPPLSNHELRRLSTWLYLFIDRYDVGRKHLRIPGSTPRFLYKTECLNRLHLREVWLSKLTERNLREHLAGNTMWYYTSQQFHPVILLRIDIDAHEGQEDAIEVAQWIASEFFSSNTAYVEESERGASVFFLYRSDSPDCHKRKLMAQVADALGRLASHRGFKANVDKIAGTPSLTGIGGIRRRGILGKIPRPRNGADVDRLYALCAIDVDELRPILRAAQELPLASEVSSRPTETPSEAPLAPPRDWNPLSDHAFREPIHTPRGVLRHDSPDALVRTFWLVYWLSNRLGRRITPREAKAAYERMDLATGEDDGHRLKRFEYACQVRDENWDPQKAGKGRILLAKFHRITRNRIPHEKLTNDRCRVSHRMLGVFAGLCVHNALHGRETSRKAIKAFITCLREDGDSKPSFNNDHYRLCLKLLRGHRILELEREYMPPTWNLKTGRKAEKGRARLLVPGVALGKIRQRWENMSANVSERWKEEELSKNEELSDNKRHTKESCPTSSIYYRGYTFGVGRKGRRMGEDRLQPHLSMIREYGRGPP